MYTTNVMYNSCLYIALFTGSTAHVHHCRRQRSSSPFWSHSPHSADPGFPPPWCSSWSPRPGLAQTASTPPQASGNSNRSGILLPPPLKNVFKLTIKRFSVKFNNTYALLPGYEQLEKIKHEDFKHACHILDKPPVSTLRNRLHDNWGVNIPPPENVVVGGGGVEEVSSDNVDNEEKCGSRHVP